MVSSISLPSSSGVGSLQNVRAIERPGALTAAASVRGAPQAGTAAAPAGTPSPNAPRGSLLNITV